MSTAKQHWNTTYTSRAMVAPLEFTKKVLEYVEKGSSILDIGCGDGRDSEFFAQNGLQVTAIDFSEKAIERVKQRELPIDARVMDTAAMDFPDASFDAVYAHLSLHYFDDATTTVVFDNIHRMLKPGGSFFVRCKSTKDPYFGQGEKITENVYRMTHIRHFFTQDYMREQLKDFNVIHLGESSAVFDGKESHFIDAIAKKEA